MIKPKFTLDDFQEHIQDCINQGTPKPIPHKEILAQLLEQIKPINFRDIAELPTETPIGKKHYLVISIEEILAGAMRNNWALCKSNDLIYLYNGAYWKPLDFDNLKTFLGEASEKMGVDKFDARIYTFRADLYRQFLASDLPKPESEDMVLINFRNGTFEIQPDKQILRPPQKKDFLTYQLPFDYDPNAKAPLFEKYLNKVQPDPQRQLVLAEYIGSLFIKSSTLKLEKTLLLYGSGANGKSVFFEVINSMLGSYENVSYFSLQNLTDEKGYHRAMLGNKLLNYASEINGKLETSTFKQLVSGEPVDARHPYGKPFILTDYGKLIFNCNELPRDVEHTNAYFRRFLIIPFDITIPEAEQDKQLSKKIIRSELSGVFNWVLRGLHRLISQEKFTDCEAIDKQIEEYKKQSDSVQLFIEDENYIKTTDNSTRLKEAFLEYKSFCSNYCYRSCSIKTFGDRLRNLGFVTERKNYGQAVYMVKKSVF